MRGIHRVKGYKGAYLLRKNVDAGIEFATLTLWELNYEISLKGILQHVNGEKLIVFLSFYEEMENGLDS